MSNFQIAVTLLAPTFAFVAIAYFLFYRSWKKDNPNGTFSEYRKEVAKIDESGLS